MSASDHGILRECWCCGRQNQVNGGRKLCHRCHDRWRRKGFTGPGPGPEFTPVLVRARDHEDTITRLSSRNAGAVLGVSHRTVVRWRRALREASWAG